MHCLKCGCSLEPEDVACGFDICLDCDPDWNDPDEYGKPEAATQVQGDSTDIPVFVSPEHSKPESITDDFSVDDYFSFLEEE